MELTFSSIILSSFIILTSSSFINKFDSALHSRSAIFHTETLKNMIQEFLAKNPAQKDEICGCSPPTKSEGTQTQDAIPPGIPSGDQILAAIQENPGNDSTPSNTKTVNESLIAPVNTDTKPVENTNPEVKPNATPVVNPVVNPDTKPVTNESKPAETTNQTLTSDPKPDLNKTATPVGDVKPLIIT